MLTAQTEKRVIAFVRNVANDCTTCMRRCSENCDHCRAQWANEIMADVEAEMDHSEIDYGVVARMSRILIALKSAKRPLRSIEIDVGGVCSCQLKHWTLERMVGNGVIRRRTVKRVGRDKYVYFIPSRRNG